MNENVWGGHCCEGRERGEEEEEEETQRKMEQKVSPVPGL